MAIFARKPYPSSAAAQTIGAAYRRALRKHPFAVFGLPFIVTVLAGSFFLTPATAVRYERFDRKTHMLDREEALGLKGKWDGKKEGGRADIREEYWVSYGFFWVGGDGSWVEMGVGIDLLM